MKTSRAIALAASVFLCIGVTQASPITYYIVDHPEYQADGTVPGRTDHISGTIVADPDTGIISSASFTLWNEDLGPYTCDSAIIDPDVWVHITPTQITIDRNNPTSPYGTGYLGLRSSSPTAWPFLQVWWLLIPDPWEPGGYTYDTYRGVYQTGKTTIPLQFGSGDFGDSLVIAEVPEPATLGLLALGGLAVIRRRHAVRAGQGKERTRT